MSEAEAGKFGKKLKKAIKKVMKVAKQPMLVHGKKWEFRKVAEVVDCVANPVPGSCPIG